MPVLVRAYFYGHSTGVTDNCLMGKYDLSLLEVYNLIRTKVTHTEESITDETCDLEDTEFYISNEGGYDTNIIGIEEGTQQTDYDNDGHDQYGFINVLEAPYEDVEDCPRWSLLKRVLDNADAARNIIGDDDTLPILEI